MTVNQEEDNATETTEELKKETQEEQGQGQEETQKDPSKGQEKGEQGQEAPEEESKQAEKKEEVKEDSSSELEELRKKAARLEAEVERLAGERDGLATVDLEPLEKEDKDLMSSLFSMVEDKLVQKQIFEALKKSGKLGKKTVKVDKQLTHSNKVSGQVVDSWEKAHKNLGKELK